MKFVDKTTVRVRSGAGGSGKVSFMRAKNQPKMGPDGGDGGFGGDVYLVGNPQLNTLSTLRFRKTYRAGDGVSGGTAHKTGADGDDLLIPVPLGTVAVDMETQAHLGEILYRDQRLLIAKGGKRGLGNARFLSSTHQAPEEHTPGGPAQELTLNLELKLLADIGLAGFPNAGKSTLLSCISSARPKIADYPFTTLTPQLGVVDHPNEERGWGRSLVVADIPGLIEGASEGKGLGLEFLRHLERTRIILYVLDAHTDTGAPEAIEALAKLRFELGQFSPTLVGKRSLVVLTKLDLIDDERLTAIRSSLHETGFEVLEIAAVTGMGLTTLKQRLFDVLSEETLDDAQTPEEPTLPQIDSSYKFMTPKCEDPLLQKYLHVDQ